MNRAHPPRESRRIFLPKNALILHSGRSRHQKEKDDSSWTETKRGELFRARAVNCTTPLSNTVMLRWLRLVDGRRVAETAVRIACIFRKTACIREVAGRVFPSWREWINLKYNHIEAPTISIPFQHLHHMTLGPHVRDGNSMDGRVREH